MSVRVAANPASDPTALANRRGDIPGSDCVLTDLLDRCARRDETALAQLYDITSPWIYQLIRRRTASTAMADDAMVAIYATVWRKAAGFAGRDRSALSWITSIALHAVGQSGPAFWHS
jgi:Sigma-70 region 2